MNIILLNCAYTRVGFGKNSSTFSSDFRSSLIRHDHSGDRTHTTFLKTRLGATYFTQVTRTKTRCLPLHPLLLFVFVVFVVFVVVVVVAFPRIRQAKIRSQARPFHKNLRWLSKLARRRPSSSPRCQGSFQCRSERPCQSLPTHVLSNHLHTHRPPRNQRTGPEQLASPSPEDTPIRALRWVPHSGRGCWHTIRSPSRQRARVRLDQFSGTFSIMYSIRTGLSPYGPQ